MSLAVRPLIISILVVTASFTLYRKWRHRQRSGGVPPPPGPQPAPLIGNLLQIPRRKQWITFQEWTKLYGDVLYFEAGGKGVLVLNSPEAVGDLMEKRGAIYSDRDQSTMQMEVAGGKIELFPQMKCTEEFTIHRKLVNLAFSPAACREYQPYQEKEAYGLLGRLLESPSDYSKHLRRATGAIILNVTYGHEVVTDDDHLVRLNEEGLKYNLQTIDPTNWIVNFIPLMRFLPSWAPGAGFKEFARITRDYNRKSIEIPYSEVQDKLAAGSAPTCYVTRLLEENGSITGQDDEERIIKVTAGIMYGAGAGTTLLAVKAFLLAMLLYPEEQKRIQEELDSVIGSERLPTFKDMESLPYLHNSVLESLRWKPVTPVGAPHSLAQDDVYKGWFIPKDTVVMGNVWAIFHDEKMYPDPDRFWPERWDGRFPDARDPRNFAFGFNRRICPGRHLAFNSIWIIVASILSAFNLEKAKDEEGREIELEYDLEQAERFMPWVKCSITPRSPVKAALIKALMLLPASTDS
ncbi:hypothetical protein JAAARDRAFT_155938 [Jaapia argillacea MUCL 33604]|uniref:Cytochrome P450 n=1 Tax=Jaapia argillacea MUCL 33604 TaxID=933084 RepID=A0A067PWJ8_9AGAM|nr:hypothetical protein JAAARDRAFT_155938 [Jaapia argillacea MUCL 33604]